MFRRSDTSQLSRDIAPDQYRIFSEVQTTNLDEMMEIMDNQMPPADVAELADAQASGACGLLARGGSTPLIRISLALLPTAHI